MTAGDADSAAPFPAPSRRQIDGPAKRIISLWRRRGVLGLLVRRDLKVRYSDSVLGYLWTILDPLMMALIYWFIFNTLFQRNVGEEPYLLYLLAGMLPYRWFQSVVGSAASAIKGERLVRSTALPREIWIARLVFSKGAEYLLSLPVLVAFAIGYRHGVNWEIVLMIPAMLIQTVLMLGLTLLLAPLGALVRDVDRVVHIVLRFLFYATPIIYGLNNVLESKSVPKFLKDAYIINPLTGIVSLYRAGFFPDLIHSDIIVSSIIGSVVALVVGWWVFMRLEATVLKEI